MTTRSYLEANTYKHRRHGGKRRSHWTLFERLVFLFGFFLRAANLYQRGYANATNIVMRKMDILFPDLPTPFHGYTILHLTDLHLDATPGIEKNICMEIRKLRYDLCVLTGDYRTKTRGGFKEILRPMQKITDAITAGDGVFATLGNHDTYLMVYDFEEMGLRVLGNETITVNRDGASLVVTGIDDPHYYYTDQAIVALQQEVEGFKIVLVHTPELYDLAADNGYRLYLCGHTHGGQICLPYGIPIITHLYNGRKYSRGLWQYAEMKGYTNQGCGTVGIQVRFNSQSEIALITLKRAGF